MANSKKALDENGVLYLWGKVKTYVATAIANIKLPSKTSDLTNDSGFITAKDVPEGRCRIQHRAQDGQHRCRWYGNRFCPW